MSSYRLITTNDFDGLVSAVMLRDIGLVGQIVFAHARDIEYEMIEVKDTDIIANLLYSPKAHSVFDNHVSELIRVDLEKVQNHYVFDESQTSVARVIYNHFGSESFSNRSVNLLSVIDKVSKSDFNIDEVENPDGWSLLAFILNPHTGLDQFREFSVSSRALMHIVIEAVMDYNGINEILEIPEVKERIEVFDKYQRKFNQQLKKCTWCNNELAIVDYLDEDIAFPGNRYMVYVNFPDCQFSLHVSWGFRKRNVILTLEKSIFNCPVDINLGNMFLEYGGGGHSHIAGCQVEIEKLQEVIDSISETLALVKETSLEAK